ncbi:hypothetical protein GCM10022214_52890 [Actinomadura miaoliensis]|uniref:Uncharacterized protein n=1 Tax=Actinomadura miaoliensis TaxID=430685 RepID=A0ABP7WCW4_9ACTN
MRCGLETGTFGYAEAARRYGTRGRSSELALPGILRRGKESCAAFPGSEPAAHTGGMALPGAHEADRHPASPAIWPKTRTTPLSPALGGTFRRSRFPSRHATQERHR